MNGTRFEGMLQGLAAGTSRRHILGGMIGITAAVLGGGIAEAAKGGTKGSNNKGQKKGNQKVTLCHNPGTPGQQTIVVGAPAAEKHMAHGDSAGACSS